MIRTGEYIQSYLDGVGSVIQKLDRNDYEGLFQELMRLKQREGRLFILGVGGSAANASHAVNDFRKLCDIETYAPTDNVSELTARTNDDGWETVFSRWLEVSHLTKDDGVLVFSVGGGNLEKNVSANIIHALEYAKGVGSKIMGIVGRDGGYTKQVADVCVLIPTISGETITPYAESFQALLWHGIVNYPGLTVKRNENRSPLSRP